MKKNFLEVGLTEKGEVCFNHGNLDLNEKGEGFIIFSIEEARHFANLILKKASEAWLMQNEIKEK